MKVAQDLRVNNVVLIKNEPFVVKRTEYYRPGRNEAIVRLKLKSLINETVIESVYKADDRFEVVILDRKLSIYSYYADPSYVFMDEEYIQYELDQDSLGFAINFLEDQMPCDLVLFQDKAMAVELPPVIVREIAYTEYVVRGDTTGKVMKPAKLHTGYELSVASFCEIGDKIEIDSKTGEFKKRVT